MSSIPNLRLTSASTDGLSSLDSPRTEVRNLLARSPISQSDEPKRSSGSPVDKAKMCMQIFNLNVGRLTPPINHDEYFMERCLNKLDVEWEVFEKKLVKQKPCISTINRILGLVEDIDNTMKKIEGDNPIVGSPFSPEVSQRQIRAQSLSGLKVSLEESKTFLASN
jgi:hypothetical protein